MAFSTEPVWPKESQILADLQKLQHQVQAKDGAPVSLDTQCRFLAGMVVPLFSRLQLRKLEGFGRCEKLRYAEIKQKVSSLVTR